MAIVNFAQFKELPSRAFLLSSQSLALMSREEGAEISDFDLMNLNGLYRLLADFKSNELSDRASTGVLGFNQNDGFDQVSTSDEAEITAQAISDGLTVGYPDSLNVSQKTSKLQSVLVRLAGLTPEDPVVDQDLQNAGNALTAIIEKLQSASTSQLDA